jgi:hypothetical protein
MFKFYLPQFNPDNLTGQVGGVTSAVPVSGYLGELFVHVSAPPSGTQVGATQYRKVFLKNEFTAQSTITRIWLDAVEHLGQISVALEDSVGDTSTDPVTEPTNVTGWVSPTNYSEGLEIGTLAANNSTGLWIRQTLSGISIADPYATVRLYGGGLVE